MRSLKAAKMTGKQSYFPDLIDLLVPNEEFKSGIIENLMIVMEPFQTNLQTLIE